MPGTVNLTHSCRHTGPRGKPTTSILFNRQVSNYPLESYVCTHRLVRPLHLIGEGSQKPTCGQGQRVSQDKWDICILSVSLQKKAQKDCKSQREVREDRTGAVFSGYDGTNT